MASRAPATRRQTTRRTDENAVAGHSAAVKGVKSTMAHLPPAQKALVSAAGSKKPLPVKAGAKRTALGGVVQNGKEEVKMEQRQPLGVRAGANTQARPIAPVPSRANKVSVQREEEMEVDSKDQVIQLAEDELMEDVTSEEEEEEEDEEDWLRMTDEEAYTCQSELDRVLTTFHDDVDMFDTTMVAEYADDIFRHMEDLEVSTLPHPRYMDFQTEIEWTMRTTLIDWLLQVHLRYHMLPETLWIAVNLVDRFLSVRVVSLVKLQLVGVTAMFIAAKYEEILAPSVDEFVYMTENGYTKDEILKGERIILQTLDFTISSYCSPYSWVRRISKADDYDIQTRTLSKFLMEVTLLDHRFLRCKPSMIAAIGMYVARRMLGGDWNDAFIFYSNFTERQLVPGAIRLCERLVEQDFESVYVFKKYSNKKFLRASQFAREWASTNLSTAFNDY